MFGPAVSGVLRAGIRSTSGAEHLGVTAMGDQLSMPAACSAEVLATPGTDFVELVDAEGTRSDASLAFDRQSWLDLG